VAVPAEVGLYN